MLRQGTAKRDMFWLGKACPTRHWRPDVRIRPFSVSFRLDHYPPTLWALVSPNEKAVEWRFRIVGTGHVFETDGLLFVGTFQQPPFVWHLFQVIQ